MGRSEENGLVYSTDKTVTCPGCGRAARACTCGTGGGRKAKQSARPLPDDGVVRIRREVKGRRGKCVTTIHGLPMAPGELRALASELKRKCGTGGAVKDGVIELQGDYRDVLLGELAARGYPAKQAGG